MEFLEEMINLLKHTGNIKTTEDIKKNMEELMIHMIISLKYIIIMGMMIKIIIYIMKMNISVVINLMTF